MPTLDQLTTPLRREADPMKFVGTLRAASEAAHDRVMPLSSLAMNADGDVVLRRLDREPLLLPTGVATDLTARPTRTAFRQIAERLSIPVKYLDMLMGGSATHRDLAATNVNTLALLDSRSVLFRLWLAEDGAMLRAVLSDSYRAMDSYAALQAVLLGMNRAGENTGMPLSLSECEVDVDLTPDRFRMRIAIPQIQLAVPDLLGGYRTPYSMNDGDPIHARAQGEGDVPPVLWAGLEVSNSETGQGSHTITPRAVVQICRNGLTRTVDAMRNVHLGQRLDEGVIDWSDETRRLSADLLAQQVADAVATFCSVDYLTRITDEMRAAKGLDVVSPVKAVDEVRARFDFTEAEHASILDAFTRGGDMTVLGVGQAVTAAASYAESGDRQAEMEARFWDIVGTPQAFVGR